MRERSLGESLWEAVLPEELRVLPPELGRVDAILDEDRFLEPFARLRYSVVASSSSVVGQSEKARVRFQDAVCRCPVR